MNVINGHNLDPNLGRCRDCGRSQPQVEDGDPCESQIVTDRMPGVDCPLCEQSIPHTHPRFK